MEGWLGLLLGVVVVVCSYLLLSVSEPEVTTAARTDAHRFIVVTLSI